MILPDTSVWIEHFRKNDPRFDLLLTTEEILAHPYVVVELALGDLKKRTITLYMLDNLPTANVAEHRDILRLIENNDLAMTGIGFVDAHLLASVKLVPGTILWTNDKRLARQAERLALPLFNA